MNLASSSQEGPTKLLLRLAAMTTTALPSSKVPTPEELLSLLDNSPNSEIPDTRLIVSHSLESTSTSISDDDDDSHFKSRASYQMSLQSTLSSLQSKEMIQFQPLEELSYSLTKEAKGILKSGSSEIRFFQALPTDGTGMSVASLKESLGNDVVKVGQGKAFKNGWITKLADGNFARKEGVLEVKDVTKESLESVQAKGHLEGKDGQATIKDLKSRKLISAR